MLPRLPMQALPMFAGAGRRRARIGMLGMPLHVEQVHAGIDLVRDGVMAQAKGGGLLMRSAL